MNLASDETRTLDGPAQIYDQLLQWSRRWGKQVILLSYPGEPHYLARKENQKDFQIRMKQFFDHYLLGKPEPKWMSDGVPQVKKGAAIE